MSYTEPYLKRRNRHLLKQTDDVIIAIHVLGKLFGFTSERAWHRFVVGNLLMGKSFPEPSRYNRRCRSLCWAIKWIRHRLAKCGQYHAYAVVDSLPIELCHYARVSRVKRFRDVADIGYCASKKMFFYGFKLHIQITDQSLPMGYVVTVASYHERIVAEEVMTQHPHPYTLGDKGYVSRPLQKKLHHEYGIAFWTPSRKNQQASYSKEWEQWMCRKRKIAETTFSVLVDVFCLTSIRTNSVQGFETALDGILLAYTLVALELVEQ